MHQDPFKTMDFPGGALSWGTNHYVVRLERDFTFLSSAPLGQGYVDARWIISQQVGVDAALPHPELCLLESAEKQGIPTGEAIIGLLTAVSHRDLQICTEGESEVTVTTLATVGVDHGSSPLEKRVSAFGSGVARAMTQPLPPGTINIVTLIDADLSPGALVRASTVATEGKTLALVEAGQRTRQGYVATGTPTDVTVVGHSGRGVHFEYAGSATLVGALVAHTAHHCVKEGLAAYNRRKQRE